MKIFISILLLAHISTISFTQQKKIDFTYIANCGFLLEANNKQLIIDALFKNGYGDYLVTPDSISTKIINCKVPFNKAQLMLITHDHEDHFNDSMVLDYLNNNRKNILIAPHSVVESVLKNHDNKKLKNQVVEIDIRNRNDTIIQGIRIKSFFLQHDNRPDIENVGYLIDMDGIIILHTGDCTGADTIQLKNLEFQNKHIDLAFLNFYGFWRGQKNRNFTKEVVNPKKIILMHIPPKEIESIKTSVSKISNFIDITVFDKCMEKRAFLLN